MTKHILIGILLFAICIYGAVHVFAISLTPTPTPQVSQIQQQIDNLQNKIASRVAQMNLVEKRGFIGTVTDVAETQITVTDLHGDTRIIDVDELTKFSSPSVKSSFGISDISKGATIGVIGLYNKDSRRLLARWVDVLNLPKVFSGGVLTVDSKNYTFTMATVDSQAIAIDVEDITRTNSYTQTGDIVKSGFSKITTGERIMVVGFPDKTDPNLIIAQRILLFPALPVNPRITMINPTDTAPISTGSGKKVQPITK